MTIILDTGHCFGFLETQKSW